MTPHTIETAATDNPGVIAMPPFLYLGVFLVAVAAQWLVPLRLFPTTATAVTLGLTLAVVAIAVASWGRRTMTAAGTNVRPTRPATTVVTSGPFRYSRNPLYVALTLLYVGLTTAVNTWWGMVLLVPLLATMHFGVVLREERYLDRKFGDSYRAYRSRVRRYV
jgi:protein-S-isoprenylcysteine O-methyltransferase Ste14